jgi:SET domain-containing protein
MLDNDYIIDATFYGNKARYINHSCDPNLKSDKLVVNGETHIIFMANRFIESGEELTFDYQFDYEAEKLECFCGSDKCKGRLN